MQIHILASCDFEEYFYYIQTRCFPIRWSTTLVFLVKFVMFKCKSHKSSSANYPLEGFCFRCESEN